MKIAFVHKACESLGIEYLSSLLRESGHQTKLFLDPQLFNDELFQSNFLAKVFSRTNYIIEQLLLYKPGLVGFSVTTSDYIWACNVAQKIKQKMDIPIVFGGIHPTSIPEEVIKNDVVDFVIRGEGEYALLDLVNSIETGKSDYNIKNLWFKEDGKVIRNFQRPLIQDLDELPFPDKELYIRENPSFKIEYILITGRGCPNSCTFCSNSLLRALNPREKFLRRRSVDNVIAELCIAKTNQRIEQIAIYDTDFCYDEEWLREFSQKYREKINIPFGCTSHPRNINEKVGKYLKDANCISTVIGVESLNSYVKRNILHRYETKEDVKNAIFLLRRNGIKCVAGNIISIPGQVEEDLINMVKFYIKTKPDMFCLYPLMYYPNTEINNIARRRGVLSEEQIKEINQGYSVARFSVGRTDFEKKFLMLFRLVNILPAWVSKFVINKKLYNFLFIPRFYHITFFLLTCLFYILKGNVGNRYLFRKRYQRRYWQIMFPAFRRVKGNVL